ncbi:BRO1 domain-containing protein BROX-like [Halichondria panicea]|uniref:BRO1 domain-containing protein BROX-like n=2 Tax=Halichondria panicea TaxID=6063 RepID=UPI00312B3996
MAHWFHRNPLKATVLVKFEALQKSSKGATCKEIITKLKAGRACFQELVSKHSSAVDEVTVAFTEYAGLLRGLVDAPEGGDSKLRGLTSFKWTSSCLGRTPSIQTDAWFEVISVVMQLAIWHTKHAAHIAMDDSISVDQAKEVHRSLKLAAGMFLNVKETLLPKLQATPDKGVDTDQRVVDAYAQQAQGEAQEVTIGRALEMGHKASVIFSLAMETAAIFKQAADALKTLDPVLFGKWGHYLGLKAAVYEAYAYCFYGKELLELEKCGESIRVLRHAQALSTQASKMCDRYNRTKGAGTIAHPERHPFFQKLAPMVKLHLDKSERENGFIYHHKVPEELPVIEKKQVYGLATPEDFTLPPHHPLWTPEAYAAFEVSAQASEKYDTKASAAQEEIAPVQEPDIAPGKIPQPKSTKSDCTIS